MKNFELKTRFLTSYLILVWVILAIPFIFVTEPVIYAIQNDLYLPDQWTWIDIGGMFLLFIACGIVFSLGIIIPFNTKITDEYIERKLFLWSTVIKWTEFTDMTLHNWWIVLHTQRRSFSINWFVYRNPDEVISFIENKIRNKQE